MKILRPEDDLDRLTKWHEFQRQFAQQNKARRPLDPFLCWCGGLVVLLALVICGVLLLAANEWSPGDQSGIAAQYHARQHEAATLVAK